MITKIILKVFLAAVVVVGIPLWVVPSDINTEPNVIMILVWLLAFFVLFLPLNVEKE